ncbi:hypothetical protein [Vibrio alginolyticus]|uniref:hypothetical protein n=1 Tax=Vibrio alginolyticus TaxID=663 RepID=UPI000A91E4A2|nr:hypothetical protein [Vibrio alginolyticus]
MSVVMLALDLEDAEKDQRDSFYASLDKDGWAKSVHVETTWSKNYPDMDPSLIEKNTRDCLKRASERGEVVFKASFLIGPDNAGIMRIKGGVPRLKGW